MSEAENAEYMNLINLWNCSEITREQEKRLAELDAKEMTPPAE